MGSEFLVDRGHGFLMLVEHSQHVLLVLGIAGVGTHPSRGLGGGLVGTTGHQRRDRRGVGPTFVGVVGQAEVHQQGADVGVAETELTELQGVLADRLRSGSRPGRR